MNVVRVCLSVTKISVYYASPPRQWRWSRGSRGCRTPGCRVSGLRPSCLWPASLTFSTRASTNTWPPLSLRTSRRCWRRPNRKWSWWRSGKWPPTGLHAVHVCCIIFSGCPYAQKHVVGPILVNKISHEHLEGIKYGTNVKLHSRRDKFEFGGQRSGSLWP